MGRSKIDPIVKQENDRLYQKKYYQEHREELLAYQREYRAKNPKKYTPSVRDKNYHHEWYLKNRERVIQKQKEYQERKRKERLCIEMQEPTQKNS